MIEGVNFQPGQMVRYLGKSQPSTVLLDKRSLVEDIDYQPLEDGTFLVEVPLVGKVGEFLGYRGNTVMIEIKFSFCTRPISFVGTTEDFEAL